MRRRCDGESMSGLPPASRQLLIVIYDPRRALKNNLANEGLEARKKEEEVSARKRKAEDDKTWEGEHVAQHICVSYPHLVVREPRDPCRQLERLFQDKEQEEKGQRAGNPGVTGTSIPSCNCTFAIAMSFPVSPHYIVCPVTTASPIYQSHRRSLPQGFYPLEHPFPL